MGEVIPGQSAEAAADGAGQTELARARDGDDAAFTRLVAPLRPGLHAYCYRMLGSVHDADDALQKALLRAWQGAGVLRGPQREAVELAFAAALQQTLRTIGDARVRELVTRFATAMERGDADALVALLTEDVTWSMPPLPRWYHGIAAVTDFAVQVPMTRCPSWRHRPTSANGQPAVAFYLGADASGPHDAWSITVLTLRGRYIAEITSFLGADHFRPFGLPTSLP